MYYSNNAAQQLIAVANALLLTNTFLYDPDGHLTNSTDPASKTTSQTYNARGEAVTVTDPATNTIGRAYDPAGNLIFLTNRNSHVWQFQYDAANRLTNTISPTGKTTGRVFNNRGLLQSVTVSLTSTTTFSYDAKGRMTTNIVEHYATGAMAVEYLAQHWNNAGRMQGEFVAPRPHPFTPAQPDHDLRQLHFLNQPLHIAGCAKQVTTHGAPNVFACLGQYFTNAVQMQNGVVTTNNAGIVSEYGSFFPTLPGQIALLTKPDPDQGSLQRETEKTNPALTVCNYMLICHSEYGPSRKSRTGAE